MTFDSSCKSRDQRCYCKPGGVSISWVKFEDFVGRGAVNCDRSSECSIYGWSTAENVDAAAGEGGVLQATDIY
ncbi:MAG: hypothetical protein BWY72_02161 [Bacteroidetes bacterium ADurb.Bin416]|nr:MAG: hypothetical protein BWY72_02161 [Bacteroidetes bacterium ADurb.Bin416]